MSFCLNARTAFHIQADYVDDDLSEGSYAGKYHPAT